MLFDSDSHDLRSSFSKMLDMIIWHIQDSYRPSLVYIPPPRENSPPFAVNSSKSLTPSKTSDQILHPSHSRFLHSPHFSPRILSQTPFTPLPLPLYHNPRRLANIQRVKVLQRQKILLGGSSRRRGRVVRATRSGHFAAMWGIGSNPSSASCAGSAGLDARREELV